MWCILGNSGPSGEFQKPQSQQEKSCPKLYSNIDPVETNNVTYLLSLAQLISVATSPGFHRLGPHEWRFVGVFRFNVHRREVVQGFIRTWKFEGTKQARSGCVKSGLCFWGTVSHSDRTYKTFKHFLLGQHVYTAPVWRSYYNGCMILSTWNG